MSHYPISFNPRARMGEHSDSLRALAANKAGSDMKLIVQACTNPREVKKKLNVLDLACPRSRNRSGFVVHMCQATTISLLF
mmetsp:Transcript_10491/g.15208  ORF Transcript_10491/g.15208 Transcript_10491/m.15208 type:complete len:81 (+) Transcript_10491:348-590(+)